MVHQRERRSNEGCLDGELLIFQLLVLTVDVQSLLLYVSEVLQQPLGRRAVGF